MAKVLTFRSTFFIPFVHPLQLVVHDNGGNAAGVVVVVVAVIQKLVAMMLFEDVEHTEATPWSHLVPIPRHIAC